jgi:hypothetical protein
MSHCKLPASEHAVAHKLIYLARRNPDIAASEFGEAWRSHSQLASTLGTNFSRHFTRVRQCIKAYEAKVPDAFSNTFDGAAILTMKSWDDLRAARSHPDALTTMRNDESRVFAGPVADWTMAVEEVFVAGEPQGSAALLWFARCRPDVGRERDVTAVWQAAGTDLATGWRAAGASGIALNRVVESPRATGRVLGHRGILVRRRRRGACRRLAGMPRRVAHRRHGCVGLGVHARQINFEKRPSA